MEFADDEDEQRLLDYLKKNKTLDIEKAKKELKIDVEKILEALIARNAVAAKVISENKIEIERVEPEPPKTQGYEIVTMYEYSWVDPANSSDIDNSRDFCQRLLKMNKLWTREEIDMMNNEMKDFNTDVWKYRGGWMTVPNTDGLVHVPSCRHYWKSRFVKKPI